MNILVYFQFNMKWFLAICCYFSILYVCHCCHFVTNGSIYFLYLCVFVFILVCCIHYCVPLLAGEMLAAAEPFIDQQMHPTVIISGYRQALEDMLTYAKDKVR